MALFDVVLMGVDLGSPVVTVGSGELDPEQFTGPNEALTIPGLPELLHTIAEQIESAMTTGPDETTWLGTPDAPDEVGS